MEVMVQMVIYVGAPKAAVAEFATKQAFEAFDAGKLFDVDKDVLPVDRGVGSGAASAKL